MDVTVLDDLPSVRRLAPEWAELTDRAGSAPCAHPAWCLPWWEHLGRGRLHVVTVRDGGPSGPLLGVGPFHLRPRGPVTAVRFLGHGLGAVSAPVVDPERAEAAAALWKTVTGSRSRHLDLVTYDGRDRSLPALQRVAGPGLRVHWDETCHTIDVSGGYGAEMARRRGLRKVLRRARRALEARGASHEVESVTDARRAGDVLDEITAVHDAAEARQPRQHLLRGRLGTFTRALVVEAARAGILLLTVGRIDGRAVGFYICLRGPYGPAAWLTRFDPAWSDVSPGHLLLEHLVATATAGGARAVDLMIGDFRYKRLWATGSYDSFTVDGSGTTAAAALRRADVAVVNSLGASLRRARDAWRARPPHSSR